MNSSFVTTFGLWFGIGMVVLAWFKLVPLLLGWVGFAIALPSFIVEAIQKRNMASSDNDDNQGESS